jgi:hypothetical protein
LTPPNCRFIIDDFEEEWVWSEKFDLVHGRVLTGAFQDGKRLIKQIYDALKPGGWLELQDILLPITSDDGTLRGTAFAYLQDLFFQAMKKIGRDPGDVDKYEQWMTQVGFDGVTKVSYKWPMNTWPKDKALKERGAWNLINTIDGLEGYSIRPLTQILGMPLEEVQILVAKARQDLINRQIHAYTNVYVLINRFSLQVRLTLNTGLWSTVKSFPMSLRRDQSIG